MAIAWYSPLISPTSNPFGIALLKPSEQLGRVTQSRTRFLVRAMRAVVQRVASASVEVEGRIVSEIGPGLVVLVGIHDSDTDSDADYISLCVRSKGTRQTQGASFRAKGIRHNLPLLQKEARCRKVLNMRLFANEKTERAWDQSVMQKNYGVLLVSQFTLYGMLKGNKPDFHVAMPPQRAKPFYESLVDKFRKSYNPELIKDGIFGAMMKVNLVNDGPVTMQLDSAQPSKSKNNEEP